MPYNRVIHKGEISSGQITRETILMRILYRYVFFYHEITNKNFLFHVQFLTGQLGGILLILKQSDFFLGVRSILEAYKTILFKKIKTYDEANQFINKKV